MRGEGFNWKRNRSSGGKNKISRNVREGGRNLTIKGQNDASFGPTQGQRGELGSIKTTCRLVKLKKQKK